MNPDHLLDQAERLLRTPNFGPPRQADKRRAVSSAYYAVFHKIARTTAFELVGEKHRLTPRYELVYRSITHTGLLRLCKEVVSKTPAPPYRPYWPKPAFGSDMQAFALLFQTLIHARHEADYRPEQRLLRAAEAQQHIDNARSANGRLDDAPDDERGLFVTLLVCQPRS